MKYWKSLWPLAALIAIMVSASSVDGNTLDEIKIELQKVDTLLDNLDNLVFPDPTTEAPTTTQFPSTDTSTNEPTNTQTPSTGPVTTTPSITDPVTTTQAPTDPVTTTQAPTDPVTTTQAPTSVTTIANSGRLLRFKRGILSFREVTAESTTTESTDSTESTETTDEPETSEPAPTLCMVNETAGDDDLCTRLIDVLGEIEDVTQEIKDGETGQEQLDALKECNSKLGDIVEEAREDPDFVNSINKEEFRQEKQELNSAIKEADTVVQEKIDANNDDETDPTLAIVLGVLGGLLGVALVGVGGYMFYKKKKAKETSFNSGQDNRGFSQDSELASPGTSHDQNRGSSMTHEL